MPILSATATTLSHLCAGCGAESTVDVSTLAIGNERDPSVIALPPCVHCNSNECVIQTFDAPDPPIPGSHHEEHKKVVNALAAHLIAKGQVTPGVTPRSDTPALMGTLDGSTVPRPRGRFSMAHMNPAKPTG